MFWRTLSFALCLILRVKFDNITGVRMKIDEVCSCHVRRACSPCRSLIGWLPFVSCARLMKNDAIVNQLLSQGVISGACRWLLMGFAVHLSSRIWVSASRLAFVRHHWSLPSPLMIVSSLLVSRSYSHLLVESFHNCWVVVGKTRPIQFEGSSSSYSQSFSGWQPNPQSSVSCLILGAYFISRFISRLCLPFSSCVRFSYGICWDGEALLCLCLQYLAEWPVYPQVWNTIFR